MWGGLSTFMLAFVLSLCCCVYNPGFSWPPYCLSNSDAELDYIEARGQTDTQSKCKGVFQLRLTGSKTKSQILTHVQEQTFKEHFHTDMILQFALVAGVPATELSDRQYFLCYLSLIFPFHIGFQGVVIVAGIQVPFASFPASGSRPNQHICFDFK